MTGPFLFCRQQGCASRMNYKTCDQGTQSFFLRCGFAAAVVLLVTSFTSGAGGTQDPPAPPPPGPPQTTNTSGLDARPSNTTCVAPQRATGSAPIGTQRVLPSLNFAAGLPISLQQAPGDGSRWFVVQKLGDVRVFPNDQTVRTTSQVITIADKVETTCAECGLLGMAFHPDFPTDPRVYLFY